MECLKFDLSQNCGKFKILNATNGGPWHKRHATDQYRSNFEEYKAAHIPYQRNHDSNLDSSIYGAPYAHDISAIFPDFEKDPCDPEAYDFSCTDESILTCLEAGTKTFFRLGQSIEHQIKKHATLAPKDFKKWAVICEHIIRHYNEGWANGYKLGIDYWEIWNEPDLDSDNSDNKRTWGGTKAEFFDLFETASKHLKALFPNLKIGGPALAWNYEWADEFLFQMQRRSVEIDFFSWHIYCTSPDDIAERAEAIKALLLKHGYKSTESILNEWNYVKNWDDKFVYSIQTIHGIKGAAFIMSCITLAQRLPIDMMMYYDTRPSAFCGVFDFYTCKPLKGYYPLKWYGLFYSLDYETKCQNQIKNIYSLCGVDKNGKSLTVITNYSDDETTPDISFTIDFGKKADYDIFLLDSAHDAELIKTTNELCFTLPLYSVLLIKEK